MTREEWKKVINKAYDEAHKERIKNGYGFNLTPADVCDELLGYIYRAL